MYWQDERKESRGEGGYKNPIHNTPPPSSPVIIYTLLFTQCDVLSPPDMAFSFIKFPFSNRGNLDKAISLFHKSIDLVRTETEMAQTFSLCEAAKAQKYVTENMGFTPPTLSFSG